MLMKYGTKRCRHERGVVLIEVMMAALLFLLGLVGLMSVAGVTVSTQSDTQLRTEAIQHVSRILDTISLNVDRTSDAALVASLATFSHKATGTNCNFSGADATHPSVAPLVAQITDGAIIPPATVADPKTRLPGSTANMQQITVDAANSNQVTVRVCWRSSNDPVARQHIMSAFIN